MPSHADDNTASLQRRIGWKGAFWVASGVPALVLFSVGGVAATVGTPSWLVWMVSVLIGFLQSFVYAEIAGIFPNKSGGASVYGAAAWVRYSKLIAPVSVWSNWLAWTPTLAIGCGIAAGYVQNELVPDGSTLLSWEIRLLDLGFMKDELHLRVNSTFVIGAVLMLVCFGIQHRGILGTARVQMIMGAAVIIPLIIVGIVPLLIGEVSVDNLTPFAPGTDPATASWDIQGWSLFLGGLFIAAWSTYAFETAVCYTSEFKNPKTDTFKALFYSGLLCIVCFSIVPFAFQGSLGLEAMLQPGIFDGTGVAEAMASMLGLSGTIVFDLMVVMMFLAVLLAIMTSMAGSSRTLYQGSRDGWLPKYLGHINANGAPTRAMGTDLGFNLLLLTLSDYLFVLAISNVCYIVFNFLNLNAGWLHRIDSGHVARPWKAPNWLMTVGVALGFFNMVLLGAGANLWGRDTLLVGLVTIALIIPVFAFRHYVIDRGRFPESMLADLHIDSVKDLHKTKAGILPYIALLGGVAVAMAANLIFR